MIIKIQNVKIKIFLMQEMFRTMGEEGLFLLLNVFKKTWTSKKIPEEWKWGIIIIHTGA